MFKTTIEAFYFEHYIKETNILVNCETHMRAETVMNFRVARNYTYEHSAGPGDRDVVFGPITKHLDHHFSIGTINELLVRKS